MVISADQKLYKANDPLTHHALNKRNHEYLGALIFIYGIRGEEQFPEPLTKLNDVITTRINEILEEHSKDRVSTYYSSLQRAVELPISLLDKKIEAYIKFKVMQMAEKSQSVTINSSNTLHVVHSETASASRRKLTRFEKKILKLLTKLGIYDNFTARVFKAIFSYEKQLKKLKKKLDELEKDMNSDNDSLWDFIIDLF